jgi:hypothetical protein
VGRDALVIELRSLTRRFGAGIPSPSRRVAITPTLLGWRANEIADRVDELWRWSHSSPGSIASDVRAEHRQ